MILNPWSVPNVQRVAKFAGRNFNIILKLALINRQFREVMTVFRTGLLIVLSDGFFFPLIQGHVDTFSLDIMIRHNVEWLLEQLCANAFIFSYLGQAFVFKTIRSNRIGLLDIVLRALTRHDTPAGRHTIDEEYSKRKIKITAADMLDSIPAQVIMNCVKARNHLILDIVMRTFVEHYPAEKVVSFLEPAEDGDGLFEDFPLGSLVTREMDDDGDSVPQTAAKKKARLLTVKVLMDHIQSLGRMPLIDEMLFVHNTKRSFLNVLMIAAEQGQNDVFKLLVTYCRSSENFFRRASVSGGFLDMNPLKFIEKVAKRELNTEIRDRANFFSTCVKFVNEKVLPLMKPPKEKKQTQPRRKRE